MIDLTYLKQGLFTVFFPQSKSGEDAWREIASKTEGTGKIFSINLKDTLKQLRKAGFTVTKVKKPTQTTDKKIKKIIQDCSFTIEGKEWRIFKKSDYYKWIKEHKEGELVDGLEWSLEDCVRDCAGNFIQAIRYLNL